MIGSLSHIPRAALLLGLAGVLPFAWGAVTTWWPGLGDAARPVLGPRMIGPYAQNAYGIVILSFMSGVLWGFATRAQGARAAAAYGVSTLPALYCFFFVGGGAAEASLALMMGFAGLLAVDWAFWRQGLTPPWWMALRSLLTGLVLVCLALGYLAWI